MEIAVSYKYTTEIMATISCFSNSRRLLFLSVLLLIIKNEILFYCNKLLSRQYTVFYNEVE